MFLPLFIVFKTRKAAKTYGAPCTEGRFMNLDAKSENLMASYKILCTSSGPRVCEALLLIECLCPFKGSLIQGQSIGSLRSGMLNGNSLKHFLLFQVLAECKL